MQIIFNYLSGKIAGQEFIQLARSDDNIPAWFQALIPAGAEIIDTPFIPYQRINGIGVYQCASSNHPFFT